MARHVTYLFMSRLLLRRTKVPWHRDLTAVLKAGLALGSSVLAVNELLTK